MSSRIESACSIVVAAAAVAMAITYTHQSSSSAPRESREPAYEKGWTQLLDAGVHVGPSTAPVKLVEFGDFQCPYCGQFAATVDSIRGQFGDRVELIFIHVPIPGHRAAIPAARASECAAKQGRFGEFYGVAFARQDSLGSAPWQRFAELAGVKDTSSFDLCVNSAESFPRIDTGPRVARQFNVTGTPTVILNGWRYYATPRRDELAAAITALLRHDDPYPRHRFLRWFAAARG